MAQRFIKQSIERYKGEQKKKTIIERCMLELILRSEMKKKRIIK